MTNDMIEIINRTGIFSGELSSTWWFKLSWSIILVTIFSWVMSFMCLCISHLSIYLVSIYYFLYFATMSLSWNTILDWSIDLPATKTSLQHLPCYWSCFFIGLLPVLDCKLLEFIYVKSFALCRLDCLYVHTDLN